MADAMIDSPAPEAWRSRAGRWLRRYGPAEIAAIIGSYVGYLGVLAAGGGALLAAWLAAWTENIGFYSVMVGRTLRQAPAGQRLRGLAQLAAELGPAEALDSLLLRPIAVAGAVQFLGIGWGVLVGKLAADATFYLIAILSHERLRRRTAGEAS
jgi:hypothetical protein